MSEGSVVRACALSALPDPGAREFLAGDGDWPFRGFVVHLDGQLRAFANVCPHKRFPLNLADDEFLLPGQKLLHCASHGALFEPDQGLCVFGPCAGRHLERLECWVDGDEVMVRVPRDRFP